MNERRVLYNRVCSDRILRKLIRQIFEINGWKPLCGSGSLKISFDPRDVGKNKYVKVNSAQIDLALVNGDKALVLEIKSLLYAKLRKAFSLFRQISKYNFWHTRYHFSSPAEAYSALKELEKTYNMLKELAKLLFDKKQDAFTSIAELYREALGFLVDSRLKKAAVKIIGVVMPWYAEDSEKVVAWECMMRLKDYLRQNHSLDLYAVLFIFEVIRSGYIPRKICIRVFNSDIRFIFTNRCIDIPTHKLHIVSCDNCKYSNYCP